MQRRNRLLFQREAGSDDRFAVGHAEVHDQGLGAPVGTPPRLELLERACKGIGQLRGLDGTVERRLEQRQKQDERQLRVGVAGDTRHEFVGNPLADAPVQATPPGNVAVVHPQQPTVLERMAVRAVHRIEALRLPHVGQDAR